MQLCATLTRDDLVSIVEQLTPLRVAVRPKRVISLGRPTRIELVAGAGLRLRGDARFTWDAYGVTIPVTLRAWQILLVPSFVARRNGAGHVLAFEPKLEELDFKGVPMFLDERISEGVRNGLAAQKGKLAWDFENQLSLTKPLPVQLAPAGELTLAPNGGNITVTADDIRLTLEFALRVRRDALPPSLRQPSPSRQGSPSSRSARV